MNVGDHWTIRRNRKRYPLHKRNLGLWITEIRERNKLLSEIPDVITEIIDLEDLIDNIIDENDDDDMDIDDDDEDINDLNDLLDVLHDLLQASTRHILTRHI